MQLEITECGKKKIKFWRTNDCTGASTWPQLKIVSFFFFFFVLRKKGSKAKKRMKEEEIEKGDCGPPIRKVFFERFCWRMVRWCIWLTRLTLICEVIRYRLVQV